MYNSYLHLLLRQIKTENRARDKCLLETQYSQMVYVEYVDIFSIIHSLALYLSISVYCSVSIGQMDPLSLFREGVDSFRIFFSFFELTMLHIRAWFIIKLFIVIIFVE